MRGLALILALALLAPLSWADDPTLEALRRQLGAAKPEQRRIAAGIPRALYFSNCTALTFKAFHQQTAQPLVAVAL